MAIRIFLAAAFCLGAMAQNRGAGPIGHGFGNVVFPGTGIPRGTPPPVTGHIPNLSSTVRGVYPAAPGGYRGAAAGVYPVAVPVVVGGYGYGSGYSDYPQQGSPNVTVINAPQPSPTVIINHNYTPDGARPVMRDYTGSNLPETPNVSTYQAPVPANPDPPKTAREDTPTIYLIAMQDGTVYSAYAYWTEGDTLHYITTKHSHNRASVDLVDSRLSEQLNRERGLDFKLRR